MSKRKEDLNGAKSINILTGIVLFLQKKLFLDVARRKKEGSKNITSIRMYAKKKSIDGEKFIKEEDYL